MTKVYHCRGRDDWETPVELFERLNKIYRFEIDVAADAQNSLLPVFVDEQIDALAGIWQGFSWCNPPYSRWQKFVTHGYELVKEGLTPGVMFLLPARTDTRAFHDIIQPHATLIRFIRGRLKFTLDGEPAKDAKGRPVSAPFPSMLVLFTREAGR
jgi:site-specific DNA-methyltransferase (adenine-specific)